MSSYKFRIEVLIPSRYLPRISSKARMRAARALIEAAFASVNFRVTIPKIELLEESSRADTIADKEQGA